MAFGTNNLQHWVLGPSGQSSMTPPEAASSRPSVATTTPRAVPEARQRWPGSSGGEHCPRWQRAEAEGLQGVGRGACANVHLYIYTYMCTYMYLHAYAYAYIHIYIHMHTCISINRNTYMCVSIAYIYVFMYMELHWTAGCGVCVSGFFS